MTVLEQPVFVLAPPRSGSTLLFETLSLAPRVYSLGDEGHGIIERHPALTPRPFSADSNRLTASDCSAALAEVIRADFLRLVRDREGRLTGDSTARLLEKTPKNILRIPFLLELFPDARFIYLYRDARDNISSIIDGWLSGRFATYRDKQTRHGPWSFLLPPGWQQEADSSLAALACFQWSACHRHAMQDLKPLDRSRWCAVNYEEFLEHTSAVVQRLCLFMQVEFDDVLRERSQATLPPSRFTLTAPGAGKWRRHAEELAPMMANAAELANRINAFVGSETRSLNTDLEIDVKSVLTTRKVGRNEPCYCGSGKKFKHCHGHL